jgi:hypothetical protein
MTTKDPKKERPTSGYTTILIQGKHYNIAPDTRQPGAEARESKGTRVLRSIFTAARTMKERDATRDD